MDLKRDIKELESLTDSLILLESPEIPEILKNHEKKVKSVIFLLFKYILEIIKENSALKNDIKILKKDSESREKSLNDKINELYFNIHS